MTSEEREAGLVASARQGDSAAFGDLYERHLDVVYRYIFYRVGNRQDAEDLTEKVFLRAWDSIGQFRANVPFEAWVFRIAHNTVIDHYRKRKDDTLPVEKTEIPASQSGAEDEMIAEERATQLAEVISRLPAPQQHVLVLRFINGLNVREVAQIMDRNEGAVRVLQHRALQAVRALFAAEEITDG
jgi:RNA polymerase sigma-70 factor (ECF subfamily)